MKTLLKFIAVLAIVLAGFNATAQQFGTAGTITVAGTNVTATATNVNTAFTLTKYDQVVIDVKASMTNACAGTLDLVWATSNDGSTVGTSVGAARGWFSVPLTNGGAVIAWNTNITINSVGYYHVLWVTNASGQSMTNLSIKAYVKPKRNG